jgi:hypothetical protein
VRDPRDSLRSVEIRPGASEVHAAYTNTYGTVYCNPGSVFVEGPSVFADGSPYIDDYVTGNIYLWWWTGTAWAFLTESGWESYRYVWNAQEAYLNFQSSTVVAEYGWNVTPAYYYTATVTWYYYYAAYYDRQNNLQHLSQNARGGSTYCLG